jgi:hypothetical protein
MGFLSFGGWCKLEVFSFEVKLRGFGVSGLRALESFDELRTSGYLI